MPASAILGEPPKAPKPPDVPDIEDVLGPPPRPPSLGKRGKSHALDLISPYRRRRSAPHAPRLGHSGRELQPRGGQKIVIEDKRKPRLVKSQPAPKTPQQEYAPQEPEVSQFAGNPIQRKARAAGQVADILEPDRKNRPDAAPASPDAMAAYEQSLRDKVGETAASSPENEAAMKAHGEEVSKQFVPQHQQTKQEHAAQINEALEKLRGRSEQRPGKGGQA